jgi:dihydrofolate synthase/folylpolyglutamate synthase
MINSAPQGQSPDGVTQNSATIPAEPRPGEAAPDARHVAALDFLFRRLNYERTASMPYRTHDPKLVRMRSLLEHLGDPHGGLPVIHVAGTKGKGSTSAMLAAMLNAAGYRTGLYSSPHLERVEERFVVGGRQCTRDELVEMVERLRPAVETMERDASRRGARRIGPTFFELTTALAWLYFKRCEAELAVVEVGMGGRLDSTNICRPIACVITSISLDHTRQLGGTTALIAREKAGILKPGVPVISGVAAGPPRQVIEEVARQQGCPLRTLGVDFDFRYRRPAAHAAGRALSRPRMDYLAVPSMPGCGERTDISLNLLGRHQAANAAVALATLEALVPHGWAVSEAAARAGLARVRLPARIELVRDDPPIVLDGAHNAASIEALLEVLGESFPDPRRRLLVFATTQGKDIPGMLRLLLPRFDQVIFTRYVGNPRAADPHQLARLAREILAERNGRADLFAPLVCDEPAAAWQAARRLATPNHLVCITGSFFLAGEMRPMLISDAPVP